MQACECSGDYWCRAVLLHAEAMLMHVSRSAFAVLVLVAAVQASAAGTHDVWQQLQRRCSRDPQLKQFEGEL